MNIDDIIVRIKLISSLDDEEISRWLPVCRDCINYIESKVKDKSYLDIYSDRLCFGAAVLFFYNYSIYNPDNSIESFKAGDIQISLQSTADYAKNLWDSEKERLSDILDFSDEKEKESMSENDKDAFFFKGVIA